MDFYTLLYEQLEIYGDEAIELVEEKAKEAGRRAKKQLNDTSPKNTGKYAKNWTTDVKKTGYGIDITVHNKKEYRRAHLLEKPHALRNGGRSEPQPHIFKAQEDARDFLEGELLKGMGKLGR